jgi:hypothetical protein
VGQSDPQQSAVNLVVPGVCETVDTSAQVPTWRDIKRQADKVALVGFASTSRMLAPFGDQSFEIWTLNDLCRSVPRWNRTFETHPRDYVIGNAWMRNETQVEGGAYWKYLCGIPPSPDPKGGTIYTLERYPEMPASVAYPFEEVEAAYSTPHGESVYLTSTPAQMLALALLEEFQEIHLYGIDLIAQEEYQEQRPCMEYYVGLGRGQGRRIVIPKQSAICKASFCYGKSFPVAKGTFGPLVEIATTQADKVERDLQTVNASVATIAAGLNFVDIMTKWFADRKGASGKKLRADWAEYGPKQRAEFVTQHQKAVQQFYTGNGTASALRSVGIWAGHLERGGVVNT